MRPFQLSLRFIVPLAIVIGISALVLLPLVDDLTQRWFLRDLDTRAQMVVASVREPAIELLSMEDTEGMEDLLERAAIDGHLLALGFCDTAGNLRYRSRASPSVLDCRGAAPPATRISEARLEQDGISLGKLLLAQDTRFIGRRSNEFSLYLTAVFLLMFLLISALATWVAHWSWMGWVSALKNLLRLETASSIGNHAPPEFRPLVGDLRAMLHQLQVERRVQQDSPQMWTPQKLRSLLHDELAGDEVLVVSNREPYIHEQS